MKRIYLKIGDILEIPLPSHKKAYVHYLFKDFWGDVIGIFDYFTEINAEPDLDDLVNKPYIFRPILTRLKQGMQLSDDLANLEHIKSVGGHVSPVFEQMAHDDTVNYNWKVIGNRKVENVEYPKFIWKEGYPIGSSQDNWMIYDGHESKPIGKKLPEEFKVLEYKANYPPSLVVERILSRKRPYEEIINKS